MRLKRSSKSGWVELCDGGALYCAPATTPIIYAARATSAALLVDLIAAGEVVTKMGGVIEGLPDLTDPASVEATRQTLFLVSLAEIVASDWRNVFELDGVTAIPFDKAHLAHVMSLPEAADAFSRNCLGEHNEVVLEGNV